MPLRVLVVYLRRLGPPPPPLLVVITADDGHRSVMTDMLPLVREFDVPVTLFIYPSAISNASYALSWDQLRALARTGLFDVQSHTYWHPNFKAEKRRLAPAAYRELVVSQMVRSRTVLTAKLGVDIDVIAWPFGIYDQELLRLAAQSGYVAGLTLDAPGDHRYRSDHGAAPIPRHRCRLGQEVRGDAAATVAMSPSHPRIHVHDLTPADSRADLTIPRAQAL